MEQRLSAALSAERKVPDVTSAPVPAPVNDAPVISGRVAAAAVDAVPLQVTVKETVTAERSAIGGDDEAPWPTDEAGEVAVLASAQENHDPVAPLPPVPREAAVEDDNKAALPALDSLVQRIPAEVRETLEDLFRAKFTAVRRVPAKALNPR